MKNVCWPYFDPEFHSLNERMHGPRVCVDNESCEACTVVKVDSVNKQGLLLEVVQVLTDMDLIISKSYISCDAGWFMDVFHVTDELGNKLTDQRIINYIQQAIGERRKLHTYREVKTCTGKIVGTETLMESTAIEMTGIDRPGLFSEISAVLTELRCNVVEAHAWSHNDHLACIVYISDEFTSGCIDDPIRLSAIEDHLSTVLRDTTTVADEDQRSVKTGSPGRNGAMSHAERRLHQLMLADRDFEGPMTPSSNGYEEERKTIVSIERCNEKGYSVVSVECKDRPKLMFDTVCTLTDMQYVVFHASISSHGTFAFQEYYIRHMDGCTLNTESEKQRVVKCLEAAIERRVCEGVRLELRANHRVGLLSDITRMLREYGLAVVRADVMTLGEESMNVFYVRGISGNEIDMEIIESMRREIEPLSLRVKYEPRRRLNSPKENSPERHKISFGDMLKSQFERFSHNFISIR